MSSTKAADAELMFTCDTCGERFNTVEDAQIHNRNAHRDSDLGSSTSTPAEDREEQRA